MGSEMCIRDRTYFDFPIHVLKNPSLIKYKFWFLVKMIRHKNSFICLIFELNFLSHVYISMQNDKTIFGYFLQRLKRFLEIFFTCVFVPEQWLTRQVGRPHGSTVPKAGRPLRSTDVHKLVHVWQTQGRSAGRPTVPESSALCFWAVGRAVDRDGPTVIFLTVGGRPGGRPLACQAARSA